MIIEAVARFFQTETFKSAFSKTFTLQARFLKDLAFFSSLTFGLRPIQVDVLHFTT